MRGKINIQPIPKERLKKGYPAYFYEEGYLFDEIEEILIGESSKEISVDVILCFEEGKYKFPATEASEFIFTHEDKAYPLSPSQWIECLDNDWYGDRNKELEFNVNAEGFAEIAIEPIELGATQRGFSNGEFEDDYGHKCSIQMSSIATRRCIWLGLNDANPLIMASKARENGVSTTEATGWVKYPIPEDVLLHTRMHLTREDVKRLLPLLTKFAETGEL